MHGTTNIKQFLAFDSVQEYGLMSTSRRNMLQLSEDGQRSAKHAGGISHIIKLLYFYCSAVVEINIVMYKCTERRSRHTMSLPYCYRH